MVIVNTTSAKIFRTLSLQILSAPSALKFLGTDLKQNLNSYLVRFYNIIHKRPIYIYRILYFLL